MFAPKISLTCMDFIIARSKHGRGEVGEEGSTITQCTAAKQNY